MRGVVHALVAMGLGLLGLGCAANRVASSATGLLPEIDIIQLRDDATEALQVVKKLQNEVAELARRVAVLEQAPGRTAVPPAAPERPPLVEPKQVVVTHAVVDSPAPRPAAPSNSMARPGQMYQSALELFQKREYEQAARLYTRLLAQEPDGAYAENARYWLGECCYAQGEYEEALRLFTQVAAAPESAKNDDALLKAGMCSARLERASEARAAWEQLLARYPQSEYAARAREFLARLR